MMLTAAEAEQLIFTLVSPITDREIIDVASDVAGCLGRVLAIAPRSQLDFPHWDNSAMDGYAVRAEDVQTVPVALQVIEEIPAGQLPQRTIGPSQAARILTGAMMPSGADTVIMQEETERAPTPEQVTILKAPQPQAFVRKQGAFLKAGEVLLTPGCAIAPAEIALLTAAQQSQVEVFRRPRVAILSTGSELVTPEQPLKPGQIVDSNQYALTALIAQTGAVPIPMGIVQDSREQVKTAIASALSQADMVLSSGGVSVGDYDFVDQVLAELGATLHIRSVAVKPGKPLTVATIPHPQTQQKQPQQKQPQQKQPQQKQLYFGLPGNPASAMVGFWRFVAPAIAKLSGRHGPWSPTFVNATATTDLTAGGRRETYLWGQISSGAAGYEFGRAQGSHSSGNLVNLVNTSGLGIVPQGVTHIAKGKTIQVLKIT